MARLRALVAVLTMATLLLTALPRGEVVQAATFTVTTTEDAPHTTPLDGNCTATNGQCTLRAAVQAANFLGGAHTINLLSGTFRLTVTGAGEDSAATGDLDLTSNITIVGGGAGVTIVDGNATDRVFDVAVGTTVSITGVTIQNGNLAPQGGGIANSGTLALTNVTVSGNNAPNGGGIINVAGANLSLTNVTITNNGATSGAGLLNNGAVTGSSLIVSGNPATNQGGGILNANGGAMSLTNATVNANSTQAGSGSLPSAGAGIMNTGSATLILTGVTLNGNTANAGGVGGGLYSVSSTANLTNVTISGNSAAFGGGIYAPSSSPASSVVMKNVTIANNTASSQGGGLVGSPATTAKNVLLANNFEGAVGGRNCAGFGSSPVTSQGNNLDSGSTCGLNASGDLSNANPQIGPLANNGGPTQTHALLQNSPAINTGGACPPPNTDQRGVARPQGSACDIGAFEFGGSPATVTPTSTPTSFPPTLTPTATSTLPPTSTPTPTVTPTPTFVPCPTRPAVSVSVVPAGGNRLQVTISANGAPGLPSNQIRSVRVDSADNAVLDFSPSGGPSAVGAGTTVGFAPGMTSVTFFVRQASPGVPATAQLTVADNCGFWPTLVGGGLDAYATAAAAAPPPAAPPTATATPIRPGAARAR